MTFTLAINPMVPLNLFFPLQRVICPQSRQSANYQFENSLLINLLTKILPNGNTLAYQVGINLIQCLMTTSPPLNTTCRGCKHWKSLSLNYKHAIIVQKQRKIFTRSKCLTLLFISFKWIRFNVYIQYNEPCWFSQWR